MTETSCAESSGYTAVHDWDSGEQVVVTAAEALAAFADVPVDELPPLYDSIDTDALDEFVRTLDPEGQTDSASVTFSVLEPECFVTVYADGRVEIEARS